jgi:branched-chain amino acid transport system permease protein
MRAISAKYIVFLIIFGILVVFPFAANNPYLITVAIIILITCLVALGCALLLHAGMISLCQAAIMGVGAYASALLVTEVGLSFWLALPLSGIVATIVGLILGLPVLRLKSIYFIQATYAINEIIILAILNGPSVLGGHVGLSGIPRPNPIVIPGIATIGFESRIPNYYLALCLVLLAAFVFYRIYVTHPGRVLYTIRVDETLAQSLGVNIAKYKILAFAVAAFFAGMAGSFYAAYFQIASTQAFGIWSSIYYVMYPQVGGHATIIGPMLGSAFFISLPEIFRFLLQFTPVIFGALIIVSIFYLPSGLESLPKVLNDLWSHRLKRKREMNQTSGTPRT